MSAPPQLASSAPAHQAFSQSAMRWFGLGAGVSAGGLVAMGYWRGAPLESNALLAVVSTFSSITKNQTITLR